MTEETLADRDLEPHATVRMDARVADVADADRWVVLVGEDGRPCRVIRPGGLFGKPAHAKLSTLSDAVVGFLTADPATTLTQALNTRAFRSVDPDTPVVLCDERGVVGVWAGFDLAEAILHGPVRIAGDTSLPGRISIPVVVRICRVCGSTMTFTEKPDRPVACTGQPPHAFGW